MQNQIKLDIALNYLNISTSKLAKSLELTDSTVSKWRSPSYDKLKKVHLFAIERAFDIPYALFEDDSIKTKEQVEEYLQNYKSRQNDNSFDDSYILKHLVGKWYCYNYTSSNDFGDYWEEILEIKDDRSVLNYNKDNALYASGKIDINHAQSIITIFRKISPINIIFDNKYISHDTFFAYIFAKTKNVGNEIAEYVIISKDKLNKEQIIYALGEKSKNQLIITNEAKERLRKALNNFKDNLDRYDPYYILKNHIGTWNFYSYSNKQKHTIDIKLDYSVEWKINGTLDSKGKIYIHEHDIIIILEDKRAFRSYLFLSINRQETKLCCLKSRAGTNESNIFNVGILSKKELSREFIQEVLEANSKSYLNMSKLRANLSKKIR